MRYYWEEHDVAYQHIVRYGYTQWNDLFDQDVKWSYDNFQNRAFLDWLLPRLDLPSNMPASVFEYGCGTGPAACYLAACGFQVEAIDLIPEAISIARKMAGERGAHVNFSVADICDLAREPVSRKYDVVLDSYCLQSIVTDEDRAAVFSAVRSRLKPGGYYVISSAVRIPGRRAEPGFHYDESTGICYREVPHGSDADHLVEIDRRWYLPHRRHLSRHALRNELSDAGFDVTDFRTSDPGDVVCRPGSR